MSGYTVAPALLQLRREVDQKWPNRSKSHDGTIGDRAHQARKSEHNPDSDGVVRAIDITSKDIDVKQLLDATIGDPRVHYVIHRGVIYSLTNGWKGRPYTGGNAHNSHVHVSLRNRTSESASKSVVNQAGNDTSRWLKSSPTPKPPTPPSTGGSGSKPKLVGTVSVAALQAARYADPQKSGRPVGIYGDQVFTLETALAKTDWLKREYVDGHYGTTTVGDGSSGFGGCKGFQVKHSGVSVAKADGWLGVKELTKLFKLAGMKVKVIS